MGALGRSNRLAEGHARRRQQRDEREAGRARAAATGVRQIERVHTRVSVGRPRKAPLHPEHGFDRADRRAGEDEQEAGGGRR